jgi:WD40 repeat protein
VTGDDKGELKLFTYDECSLIHLERVHTSAISSVSVSPDNALILTADEQGQIFFWRI